MTRPLFQPHADRVLVYPEPPKEKTASGLYIVTSEQMFEGTVVRIGPDSKVKEGEKVMFGKYAGTILTIDGTDFRIMRDSDVFGNLE